MKEEEGSVDFNISEFSKRLREIAKNEFGGIVKLGEAAGISNILLYTQKNAREPRATVLYKLAKAGVDVEYLLTGKRRISNDEINDEILRLKAKIFDLTEYMDDLEKNTL